MELKKNRRIKKITMLLNKFKATIAFTLFDNEKVELNGEKMTSYAFQPFNFFNKTVKQNQEYLQWISCRSTIF